MKYFLLNMQGFKLFLRLENFKSVQSLWQKVQNLLDLWLTDAFLWMDFSNFSFVRTHQLSQGRSEGGGARGARWHLGNVLGGFRHAHVRPLSVLRHVGEWGCSWDWSDPSYISLWSWEQTPEWTHSNMVSRTEYCHNLIMFNRFLTIINFYEHCCRKHNFCWFRLSNS